MIQYTCVQSQPKLVTVTLCNYYIQLLTMHCSYLCGLQNLICVFSIIFHIILMILRTFEIKVNISLNIIQTVLCFFQFLAYNDTEHLEFRMHVDTYKS